MESFVLVEGQTLLHGGRLRFLRRIGCGTFAVILRALDVERGCAVAVKCMQQPEYNAIGEQEVKVLRQIGARDPDARCAVVRLLDTFVEQGVLCLVLELLGDAVLDVSRWGPWRQPYEAYTLCSPASARRHKLLAAVGANTFAPTALQSDRSASLLLADAARDCPSTAPLALDDIRQIVVHLCGALAFVHSERFIHADLKPENIVRQQRRGASIKLIDFGNCISAREAAQFLAAVRSRTDNDSNNGFDVQTLAYRAPEVAAGLALSPAIDMWSLGCVLLECASGQPLFTTSPAVLSGTATRSSSSTVAENDVILRQIELLLAAGQPLSAVASAYKTAVCYSATHSRDRPHSSDSSDTVVAFASLRDRLDALALDGDDGDAFCDFVTRLLDVNPTTRLTAHSALLHPFVQTFFPFELVFARALSAPRTLFAADTAATRATAQLQGEKRRAPRVADSAKVSNRRYTKSKTKVRSTTARAHAANLRTALQLIPASAKKTL